MRIRTARMVATTLWVGLALCIAASMAPAQMCPGDANQDSNVTIAEVQLSANSYLNGCPTEQPRFVDNGDGTISDYDTGLTWEKKVDFDDHPVFCSNTATCPDPHEADNRYTWSRGDPYGPTGTIHTVFLAQLNGTCDGDNSIPCTTDGECSGIGNGLCGLGGWRDWRLPTREELVGLVDYAAPSPPVIDDIFDFSCAASCTRSTCSCTASNFYASSSTAGIGPAYVWTVTFFIGAVDALIKTNHYNARAVRAGL